MSNFPTLVREQKLFPWKLNGKLRGCFLLERKVWNFPIRSICYVPWLRYTVSPYGALISILSMDPQASATDMVTENPYLVAN